MWCGLRRGQSGLLSLDDWQRRQTPAAWREVLAAGQEQELLRTLRQCFSRGRPLGSDAWLAKLERLLGRRLRPLAVGRPKKISSMK